MAKREFDRSFQGGFYVFVGEGHRARSVGDELQVAAGGAGEGIADGGHVAQGGAHEQELRVGQCEQWDLPGPSAVGVGEEVEFVHGDAAHIGVFALAQRLVGKDLGGAADDGGAGVDVRVAGDHAHVVAAEDVDQVKEFLGNESFDGRRVVCALSAGHGHEHHAERDQRLARARGCTQDYVAARGQREQRIFLVFPGLDAARGDPFHESLVCLFRCQPGFGLQGLFGFIRFRLPPARCERAQGAVGKGVGEVGRVRHMRSVSSMLLCLL